MLPPSFLPPAPAPPPTGRLQILQAGHQPPTAAGRIFAGGRRGGCLGGLALVEGIEVKLPSRGTAPHDRGEVSPGDDVMRSPGAAVKWKKRLSRMMMKDHDSDIHQHRNQQVSDMEATL